MMPQGEFLGISETEAIQHTQFHTKTGTQLRKMLYFLQILRILNYVLKENLVQRQSRL